MQAGKPYEAQYRLKAAFVVTGALVIFFYHFIGGTLFSGMHSPPFLFSDSESFYSFFSLSHIAQFITSNFSISIIADVALFVLPLLFLYTNSRAFIIAFSILAFIYFLTVNLVTGHHYHSLVGLIVITIPFWFIREEKFDLAWDIVRYYLLYVFASAALWKIFRGSAFQTDQLINILKAQQLDLLLQNGDSLRAASIHYLIIHSAFSHAVLVADVFLQLVFITGFFTKRFDTSLFWLAIIFCVANYFVMNIISAELLILNLTLLNWEVIWQRINRLLPQNKQLKTA